MYDSRGPRLAPILLLGLIVVRVFLSDGNEGFGQSEKKLPEPAGTEKPVGTTGGVGLLPTYKPPLRGAPSGRVGGGTRGGPGGPDRSVVLSVLTPDHSGLTTKEQPSLYWFTSQPTSYPIELTVTEDQAVKPLLETRIGSSSQAGIQRIRLADYGVRLRVGVVYRWYIAVVPDPKNRSKDILAGGLIERIEPSENSRTRLSQAGAAQAPFVYAEEGIWYDALSAISDMIDAAPNDSTLRTQRASLLQQVGLQEVADFDRRAIR